ncbi:MAG: nitronate monooxygenase [Acidimicrobiales bacterium]
MGGSAGAALAVGGHGGKRATLLFVPIVVDLAAPPPVLAAGGTANGQDVAAALLGATGALVGTRFHASREALVPTEIIKAILDVAVRSRSAAGSSMWRGERRGPRGTGPARCASNSSTGGGIERRARW